MRKIQEKLDKLQEDRMQKLNRRRELGLKTISIVGYTNAGKTTLFNKLTRKKKLAEDVLFATLDSSIGKMYLPSVKKEVLVSDTIGFIQNLPTKLIQAFKSTLMESTNADLILHVIDLSDVLMHEKIDVVENVLKELGIENKKKIYVFNKIDVKSTFDQNKALEIYSLYNPQFISVKTGEGIEELKKTVEANFAPNQSPPL